MAASVGPARRRPLASITRFIIVVRTSYPNYFAISRQTHSHTQTIQTSDSEYRYEIEVRALTNPPTTVSTQTHISRHSGATVQFPLIPNRSSATRTPKQLPNSSPNRAVSSNTLLYVMRTRDTVSILRYCTAIGRNSLLYLKRNNPLSSITPQSRHLDQRAFMLPLHSLQRGSCDRHDGHPSSGSCGGGDRGCRKRSFPPLLSFSAFQLLLAFPCGIDRCVLLMTDTLQLWLHLREVALLGAHAFRCYSLSRTQTSPDASQVPP